VTARSRSATACLLRLWIRILPRAWISVSCECCVLLGRGLCDELITRPEESYRLWCVGVCDLETSWMWRPWPSGEGGLLRQKICLSVAYMDAKLTKMVKVKLSLHTPKRNTEGILATASIIRFLWYRMMGWQWILNRKNEQKNSCDLL